MCVCVCVAGGEGGGGDTEIKTMHVYELARMGCRFGTLASSPHTPPQSLVPLSRLTSLLLGLTITLICRDIGRKGGGPSIRGCWPLFQDFSC